MLDIILFILIGLQLDMLHGWYLAIIIAKIIGHILYWVVKAFISGLNN